jgi:hypothetical protein
MKTLWLLLLVSGSLAAQNWVETFADDFNGTALDLAHWSPHDPQRTAPLDVQNVKVNGGQLHVGVFGVVSTFGMFAQMYGRFEIRLRAPAGSEFFLAPVPYGILPRIEIFRFTAPETLFFGNHWGSENTERSYGDSFAVPNASKGFHTIALEWERDRITWSVDGKKTFESHDGVPQQPMYLLIHLAPHAAVSAQPVPFDIEYVRVYKRQGQ